MDKFGFIDSSGIIKKDKFFGVGFLVITNVGVVADKLAKNYQITQNITKANKNSVIDQLLIEGKSDEVIKMLRSSRRFEMKFDNLRPSVESNYEKMIDIFFSDKGNRFSAMVINRENPNFDGKFIDDSWEAYTGYSASLVVGEMRNLKTDKLCLIVDEITRPSIKPLSLEDTILSKLQNKIRKDGSINPKNIFGVLSIESHSNFLLQLTDVLLGAVMYDFKKKNNLISEETERKKENLVKNLRTILGVSSLATHLTIRKPAYFNVFEANWQKKNNAR